MKVQTVLAGTLVGALLLVSLLCADPAYAFENNPGLLLATSQQGDLDGDDDVDQNDLDMLLAAKNTPAAELNDPRDLDGDGQITALDARRLVTLCTRPGCATE